MLGPGFQERVNFRALCNIIESLTRHNIRAYEEDLLGLDFNQAEKDMTLAKSVSSQQSWNEKADRLTHEAREKGDSWNSFMMVEGAKLEAVRAYFDGGVSKQDDRTKHRKESKKVRR